MQKLNLKLQRLTTIIVNLYKRMCSYVEEAPYVGRETHTKTRAAGDGLLAGMVSSADGVSLVMSPYKRRPSASQTDHRPIVVTKEHTYHPPMVMQSRMTARGNRDMDK